MKQLAFVLMVVTLALLGCQAAASSPAQDEAAVTAAVNQIYAEYAASLKAGDPDRWTALWTEDGMQLVPDMPALDGKPALRADIGAFLDAFEVDMAMDNQEVEVAGDWAYARGLYTATLTPKDGSDPIPIDGKYLSIFQKQPDGSWKLHRDVYNSNVPPPAPEMPDEAAVTAAIEGMYDEYSASLKADDPDRWVAQWAEDGIQLPPGAPPNIGRDMIEAFNRGRLEKFIIEMDINPEEVQVAGDLAFSRGLYNVSITPKKGGDPVLIDGKFLTVFQQQPDGTWKIYRDMFNSNMP